MEVHRPRVFEKREPKKKFDYEKKEVK